MVVVGRLFVGGTGDGSEKNASLLPLNASCRAGRAVEKLDKKIASAEADVERDRQVVAEHEEKTVDLQSVLIKVERGLVGLEMQEKANVQEIERANRHRTVVLSEIEQLGREAEQLKERLDEAVAGSDNAEAERDKVDPARGIYGISSARAEATRIAT